MSLLGIQTTICVFSQFEIECVCFVFFRVGVQLIEEKYCCDCLFLFVLFCEFVKQDWDLT